MTMLLALHLLLIQNGELDRHRNFGKAYYEQGEYALAVEELTSVLDSGEASARDYFNAGMAYLQNVQQDEALAAFTTARQMDPSLVEVDFGLGVLYKRQLRFPLARDAFTKVTEHDPDDPSTWFNLGAVNFSMQQSEEAAQAFQNVLAMGYPRAQNFYVSALFRQATILARRGEQEAAQTLFAEFETLRGKTPNVSLTPTALENGRYGRVEIPVTTELAADVPVRDVALEQRAEVRWTDTACDHEPLLALGDYDGDGDVDVFVASPCGDALFDNGGDGELTEIDIPDRGASTGALFADLDNGGLPAIYTWGNSRSRLYRNQNGKLAVSDLAADLAAGAHGAIAFDADNDGRIDLFVSRPDDGLVLYRNLDDGRFESVWTDASTVARGLGAADFDDNGFIDVIAATADDAVMLSNEGGVFTATEIELGLPGTSYARVHVLDLDHDGWLDVVAVDASGSSTLVNDSGRLEPFSALRGWAWLSPLELDGDGYTSLLARDARGRHSLISYRGGERFVARPVDVAGEMSAALDASRFVGAARDGVLRVFERIEPAPAWLSMTLEGTKTNRQALGAVVEVKAGSFYQKHLYPGHPLTIFAGERDRVDVVRVTWANGVIQNEVDVATRQVLAIQEAEQQTSSCPFLYIWDGERFRFLTDVVGRAPLGEILPGGGIVEPNPDDYVRIPPYAMHARDGYFVFQLTEELRELAALDAVELLAVDHPADVEVYANERFSAPPFEPFQLYAVRERAHDVPDELTHADGRFAPIDRHRIAGFAEEHAVVLQAPKVDGPLQLFLTGWVYWPSSSSMRALDAHDSMEPVPPKLQVQDDSGTWVTVIDDLGLPSGMHRTLVADLEGKFLSKDRRVRIVSNFAVYWDRAFFAEPAMSTSLRTRALQPRTAELHYRGFSVVSLDSRDEPERYDYESLQTEPPWNAVPGRYTRYGDVMPLITEPDRDMVVMAPGDEMSLEFDAGALPPLAEGSRRTYFLHVTGWAKDQDPNTLSSRTVSPLPGPEPMRLQTREVESLVTPLVPPRP